MFRRRFLSSTLTLGLFVGACDVTALYPGVSESFGFNLFEFGKISVLLSGHEVPPDPPPDPPNDGPPDGTKDPPGSD